ncbi:MAG: hypothetical protein R3E76_12860 [Planctomycetota bacterium]
MRIGDIDRLRSDLNKDAGLAARAVKLASYLDPEAWLVATGTVTREHDLGRAYKAMLAGNDAELAVMMGFGDQALTADILDGGSSIYARRANGRNYFDSGPQPLDLMNDVLLPQLPESCLAMHLSFWGRLKGRSYRLRYGFDGGGVTTLQAAYELAREEFEIAADATRHGDAIGAIPVAFRSWGLDITCLNDERWFGAEFRLLRPDGTLLHLKLARDQHGWALTESAVSTRDERLSAKRDERLRIIQKRLKDYVRALGSWPDKLGKISSEWLNVKDPTGEQGLFGWIDHSDKRVIMLVLAPGADSGYAARSTSVTDKGQRAITMDGNFIWLKP